jgi:hypothetical protein
MKRIAVIEDGYVRDTQIFKENPGIIEKGEDWDNNSIDVKYPSQYIGIFEGFDENEILKKAADNFGVHPDIISLIPFDQENNSEPEKSNKVIVGKAINGVTINGLEYILDDDGNVKEFSSLENAKRFLLEHEITPEQIEDLTFLNPETDEEIFQEINPVILEFEHLKTHVGHKIKTVAYGKKNVTIECADCHEVLYSVDISNPLQKSFVLDETTVINKVFKKGSNIPLKPVQLAKEAGSNITPADFPFRISGSGHCRCRNGGEFELLPKSHRSVKSGGGKRYMECRICGCTSHL